MLLMHFKTFFLKYECQQHLYFVNLGQFSVLFQYQFFTKTRNYLYREIACMYIILMDVGSFRLNSSSEWFDLWRETVLII